MALNDFLEVLHFFKVGAEFEPVLLDNLLC